jgi:hypothetical protein
MVEARIWDVSLLPQSLDFEIFNFKFNFKFKFKEEAREGRWLKYCRRVTWRHR